MTADAAATLVWIGQALPDATQSDALASWARERGMTIVAPSDVSPRALPLDDRVSDVIEDLVLRAKEEIVAHDRGGADRSLDAAESLLRAHAELPQAAWLMAEVERARAMRYRLAGSADLEASDRAWARAEGLDGGRVAGVGEEVASGHATAATVTVEALANDRLWIDGRPASGPVSLTRGLHAIRVARDGRTIWATWVEVPEGRSTFITDAPAVVPCSVADTSRARVVEGEAAGSLSVIATDVTCRHWLAATPGREGGTVGVALCEAARCGPVIDWHRPTVAAFQDAPALPRVEPTRRWPAWATWALAGAAVAVAASSAVLLTAALKAPSAETVFVSGGLKTQ